MSMVVVTSNEYDGDCDLNGVTDAYYVVVSPKPFEAKWNAFKTACREHFVTYHIVFITPLMEHPEMLKNFLFSYAIMLGHVDEDVRVYD